jgi:hypothetical protein
MCLAFEVEKAPEHKRFEMTFSRLKEPDAPAALAI